MMKRLLNTAILSLGMLGVQQAVAQTTPEDPLAPKKNTEAVQQQQEQAKEKREAEEAEKEATQADGLLRVRNEYWSYSVGGVHTRNSIVDATGLGWRGQGPLPIFFAGVKTVGKPTKYKSKSQAFWLTVLNAEAGIDILRTPKLQYSQSNYYQSTNGPVYQGTSVSILFAQAFADFKLGKALSIGDGDVKLFPYGFGGVATSPGSQNLTLQNSTNTRLGVGIDAQIGSDGNPRIGKDGKPHGMGRRRGVAFSLKWYKESYNPNQTFGNSLFLREAVQPGGVFQFSVGFDLFQGWNTDEDGASLTPDEMQGNESEDVMPLEYTAGLTLMPIQGEEIDIDGEPHLFFELYEMLDDLGIQVEDQEETFAMAPSMTQRHVLS
jgi:hypothetical protein